MQPNTYITLSGYWIHSGNPSGIKIRNLPYVNFFRVTFHGKNSVGDKKSTGETAAEYLQRYVDRQGAARLSSRPKAAMMSWPKSDSEEWDSLVLFEDASLVFRRFKWNIETIEGRTLIRSE